MELANIRTLIYKSPYIPHVFIGEPAPPGELVDRDEEVKELLSYCTNPKINYTIAVIGHRRVGKSSILKKVENELFKKGTIVVYFDVKKNLSDPEVFLKRLESEIFNAYIRNLGQRRRTHVKAGKFGSEIIQALSGLLSKRIKGVGIEVKAIDGQISVMPKLEFGDKKPDYQKMFDVVFKTAKVFAEKSDKRFVMILDEFQDIAKLSRYKGLTNILDLFRSIVQERGKNVSYVICGSRVHMLKTFLQKGKSPLFMHFKEFLVGEMKEGYALLLFKKYSAGKGIVSSLVGKGAKDAFDIVGGHPFYLMSLAESWDGKRKMYDLYRESLSSPTGTLRLYVEYVLAEDIGEAQGGPLLRTILRLLASKGPMSIGVIANALQKPATYMVPYINELLKFDLLVKQEDKTYRIRDRVVLDYLKIESEDLSI
jgi:AAA+ ATPase superfamily predicted ATPase